MKLLCSIGLKHCYSTGSDPVVDVRKFFGKNPYHDKKLRYLRGTDEEVQREIESAPFFEEKFQKLQESVGHLLQSHDLVYLACTGGHHRSVYAAERLSKVFGTDVLHLHLNAK